MKQEWMPVNPCDTCSCSPKNDPQTFDGCEVSNTCVQYGIKIGGVIAQKKLLVHLMKHPEILFPYTYIRRLESMLKQLEETK